MSCYDCIAIRIYCYLTIMYINIPILSPSNNDCFRILYLFFTPSNNVIYVQRKIPFYSFFILELLYVAYLCLKVVPTYYYHSSSYFYPFSILLSLFLLLFLYLQCYSTLSPYPLI